MQNHLIRRYKWIGIRAKRRSRFLSTVRTATAGARLIDMPQVRKADCWGEDDWPVAFGVLTQRPGIPPFRLM